MGSASGQENKFEVNELCFNLFDDEMTHISDNAVFRIPQGHSREGIREDEGIKSICNFVYVYHFEQFL